MGYDDGTLSLPVIGPVILVQIKVKSPKVQIKQVNCENTGRKNQNVR